VILDVVHVRLYVLVNVKTVPGLPISQSALYQSFSTDGMRVVDTPFADPQLAHGAGSAVHELSHRGAIQRFAIVLVSVICFARIQLFNAACCVP
jgi:hypothetical protein